MNAAAAGPAENPLLEWLRRRIAVEGPLTVADFMAEALTNPRWGYYMTADPFGAAGDFITAPEISQMFGELIGLWCAIGWTLLGCPQHFALAELGPGRGTLMADALRAVEGVMPAFTRAAQLHLLEASPVLREKQAAALGRWHPRWIERLDALPELPLLLVANEFFDALPVRQFQRTPHGWAERLVDVDPATDRLRFVVDRPRGPSTLMVPPALATAPESDVPAGTVIDLCPTAEAIAQELGARLARLGGMALIVDYGHASAVPTDTLQALKAHRFVPVLEDPGQADLTTHVNFPALAAAARLGGAVAHGPVGQGAFLRELGIARRAEMLRQTATPEQASAIDAALARLTGDDAMGRLFQALSLTAPGLPLPAGFEGMN